MKLFNNPERPIRGCGLCLFISPEFHSGLMKLNPIRVLAFNEFSQIEPTTLKGLNMNSPDRMQ